MNEADASLKSKAPGTRPGGVVRIRRALISVWDKAGIIDLAAALHQMGVGILSTGGTAQALREAEIPVTTVESITGYPAIRSEERREGKSVGVRGRDRGE